MPVPVQSPVAVLIGLTEGGFFLQPESASSAGGRLLIVASAHFATSCFELRLRLFQLGLLLSS